MKGHTNDDVAGGVAVGPADKGRRLQKDDVGCLCPGVLVLLKLACTTTEVSAHAASRSLEALSRLSPQTRPMHCVCLLTHLAVCCEHI